MKKLLFIFLLSAASLSAQTWDTKALFKERGADLRSCDTTTYERQTKRGVIVHYKKCKVLRWEMETRTGYVNVWTGTHWITEWIDGDCWTCSWEDIEVKIKQDEKIR